jgi:hypothetical protein
MGNIAAVAPFALVGALFITVGVISSSGETQWIGAAGAGIVLLVGLVFGVPRSRRAATAADERRKAAGAVASTTWAVTGGAVCAAVCLLLHRHRGAGIDLGAAGAFFAGAGFLYAAILLWMTTTPSSSQMGPSAGSP